MKEQKTNKNFTAEKKKHYNEFMLDQHFNMYFVAASSFDKAILGLSSAALAFTIAFLKFLGDDRIIYHKCLLYSAWIFFIVAILFILLALIFVEKYALHRIEYFSYEILDIKNSKKPDHWAEDYMESFQHISAFSYVFGILLFALFALLNF